MPINSRTIPPQIRNLPIADPTKGIVIKSVPVATLARLFNVQNLRSVQPVPNQYTGQIPQDTNKDAPIDARDVPYLDVASPLSPILTDLNLKSVTYTDMITNRQSTTEELYFACVLINVAQAKRIVKTEIQGRNGTVKEYIGLDDFQVTVSGIIVNDNGAYPFDQVAALKRTLDAPVPIPVVNPQLNALNIFSLVAEGYDIPQEAGKYSQQPFTINFISDEPIELQLQ